MDVRQGDALHELPKMADKSYDLVMSGLWPNPTPNALEIIAHESVRIARKAIFIQTVTEDDHDNLKNIFRKLGYSPRTMLGIKIQQSLVGNAEQWQFLITLPGTTRQPIELPFERPYGGYTAANGATTGNELCSPDFGTSKHRANPEGTRQSTCRHWMPVTVERKSLLPNQPSQPISIPKQIIQEVTKPGDSVLDFSCGSGTNLVAAKTLFRRYTGFDINPEHVTIARNRIAEATIISLQASIKLAIEEMMIPLRRMAKWAPKKKAATAGQ